MEHHFKIVFYLLLGMFVRYLSAENAVSVSRAPKDLLDLLDNRKRGGEEDENEIILNKMMTVKISSDYYETKLHAINNDCSRQDIYTRTRNDVNPWWTIDLGRQYNIKQIIVQATPFDYFNEYFTKIYAFVKDGDTFPEMGTKVSVVNSCAHYTGPPAIKKEKITFHCTDSGRYVSICKQGKGYLAFCSIRIFGAGTQISLNGKSIKMTSREETGSNAIKNADCFRDDISMTQTDYEKNPGWLIDLEERYKLEKIIIVTSDDDPASNDEYNYVTDDFSFSNIYAFVRDVNHFQNLIGPIKTNCSYYHGPAKEKETITMNCTDTGRFVSIRKKSTGAVLIFCGIKIFGVRVRSGRKVDGIWSDWNSWGTCSQTCGGVQTRNRSCNNPEPKHGGKECEGDSSVSRVCENIPACPNPCKELKLKESGVHNVTIDGRTISVNCEIDEKGEAWIIVQRRTNGQLKFDKTWLEYKNGFGSLEGDFWMGNENLFLVTGNNVRKVRFDLWDEDGDRKYSQYESFHISDEKANYRLKIAGHSGTSANEMAYHNEMDFSTKDRDNDKWGSGSCSEENGNSGWWFRICSHVNLNHEYDGIFWHGVSDIIKTVIKIS